ncbi:terminase ATPase subunit family protein [Marinobacterium sedimentorum]|uniref:terminase ATPase subunit family protein n=1 Tax=Marinobacterium sedimentorum TaxID=2927804 RepID=UPI0020C6A9A6|nr:terminase ATPase subunit family protein [Marinobacterium sedimentorum]MCP8687768.1 terminase ATPase subunit family protein [Marinobacterium sedimentorum]
MNAHVETPDLDPRRTAKHLYWQGFRVARIAEMLGEKAATVHSWKARDDWDAAKPIERVEGTLEARLIQLILKDPKDGRDFKEIDLLGRQVERLARVRRYEEPGGHEGDLNPKVANRNANPKRKPVKNDYTEEQAEQLRAAFFDELFGYQKHWYRAGEKNRIRNILKSRQIGATYYFAREALLDAVETGRNQIFLSASKAQAHVFKQYITAFARGAAGIELTGDPIVLPNGATLYFLGTNARTAQSYHGNLYFDEYFWTYKFQELRKVASGMAMHKKWRQTYISTPSSLSHDAYPFWAGQLFNKGRAKKEHIDLDISHAALKDGRACEDGQWRHIVTVEDALTQGCDLFDLDQLRLEYSEPEYRNLLMCEFVDDNASLFGMLLMQRCMVDSWEVWDDFKPFAARPVANQPVWIGYDPNGESETGDNAGLAVILPPAKPGGKYRIIERHQFRGLDYEDQAEQIRQLTKRYNVTHIGIDTTGIGSSVYQLVRKFYPGVTQYQYNPEIKGQLVMKAYNLISKGRVEFDAGWIDMAQSFMAIRKTTTASGRHITFVAGRNGTTGHADLAWAVMHALDKAPLDIDGATTGTGSSMMEIY